MKGVHVISLVLLTGAAVAGLTAILLELTGTLEIDHQIVIILHIAVALFLFLSGFFLGALYKRQEARRALDTGVVTRLKEALELERKQRLSLSRERYQQRQNIVTLEGKLKKYTSEGLPPAEAAELQLTDDDLAQGDELEQLATTCDRLRSELTSRKERMVDLQAELSVAQTEVEEARVEAQHLKAISSIPPPEPSVVAFKGESLNDILDGIVSIDGIVVALVADDQGLLVDAAGEALRPDALAAVTGLVAELSPRVTELLPIGEIVTVALGDLEGKVMEVRYFELFDARCALAIIRDEGAGHPDISRNAVDAIYSRLC